jgi:hypothetical protein
MKPVAGSTVEAVDLFRRVVRDGLDVHAALGRDDERDLPVARSTRRAR